MHIEVINVHSLSRCNVTIIRTSCYSCTNQEDTVLTVSF